MSSALPSGTVTFLFTDIEGSTQLLHNLGAGYDQVLADHERILRSAFDAHGGRIVDTQGDSFFVAFSRGKDAVAAAADAQRDLAAHAWPEGTELKVRMGLHTGEPRVGADRYVGMGVHKAARIGAAGHGGQVLLSRTTRELVADELPAGVSTKNLGERRLKDVEEPERLFQLVIEGLPSEFGQLKTLDVELQRKRRRMYAGAALIGALTAAIAVPVFAFGQGSGGGTDVAPNSLAVIDPASNTVVGSVSVGVRPAAVATGEGSVWVANTVDETVSRIDARTRELIRTIPVGDTPTDVAVGAGSTWVAFGSLAEIRRIAVERNEAEEGFAALEKRPANGSITVPFVPWGDCSRVTASLTAGGGALWFACSNALSNQQLTNAARISVLTKEAVRIDDALSSFSPLGIVLVDVAFGLGSVWIANSAANVIVQIQPQTLRYLGDVPVGKTPTGVTTGFDSVWVANTGGDTVSRFQVPEPAQPADVVTIPVGDEPVDVAAGGDAVWVVNRGDRSISRIDPETNEVVTTIELENDPVRIAAGEGAVWVTVQEGEAS